MEVKGAQIVINVVSKNEVSHGANPAICFFTVL